MKLSKLARCICVMFFIFSLGSAVSAADFPKKKITIINPWSSGGTSYLMASTIAPTLERILGQKVVVVNKPGGGGGVGMLAAKNARADGHTIILTCLGPCGLTPNKSDVGYNTPEDFAAIAQIVTMPYAVGVNPKSGIDSFEQLMEMAKKTPGELTYGSPGASVMQHIMFNDFLNNQDVKMKHVPYSGGAEAMSSLLGNHVNSAVLVASAFLPHYQAETVNVLAVTGEKRLEAYPDVPTFKELGYETIVQGTWFGFAAPKGVDKEKIQILEAAVKEAIESPEVIETFNKSKIVIEYKGSGSLDKVIAKEYTDLAKLVKK